MRGKAEKERTKIGFTEQKRDKGWINRRNDDEVLGKGKYVHWQRQGAKDRGVNVSLIA